MQNKILITGGQGLVGSRVVELLNNKYEILTPDLPEFDITNSSIKPYLDPPPQVLIHLAAFTDVNAAQTQKDLCWQINVEGTKNILSFLQPHKTHIIYVSTDMVFPGTSGPYQETDQPASNDSEISWYAWTKLQAEKLINTKLSTIVRIIYPVRSYYPQKLDFLRTPLKKFDEGQLYPLFSDQKVSITFIDELAIALDKIIEKKLAGIFHVSSPDTASPYEIVSYLLQKSRNYSGELKQSSVTGFPPSRYPQFGALNPSLSQDLLKINFSPWRQIVDKLISQQIRIK